MAGLLVSIDTITFHAGARLQVVLSAVRKQGIRWGGQGNVFPAGPVLLAADIRADQYGVVRSVPIMCRQLVINGVRFPARLGGFQGALIERGYDKRVYVVLYANAVGELVPRAVSCGV